MWFSESEKSSLFVYDDGSSITSLNNSDLFIPDSIVFVNPIKVRNSSQMYTRISQRGDAYCFGNVYYDKEQFISIICSHDIERDDSFVVTEKKDTSGRREGYDIFLKELEVTLLVRWHGKIMIGSFQPLLDRIFEMRDERETDHNFLTAEAKASSTLKTMAKAERAVNKVRSVQYRMGFQSDEHASISCISGFYKNLPLSESDFRYSTAVAGPDISMMKGKGTIDRKIEYVDLVPELKDSELLFEIDIGFIGRHAFLIGISEPLNYGVSIYLGFGAGCRSAGQLYNAILKLKSVIKEYEFNIKFLMYDSERSLSADAISLPITSIQDRLKEEHGILCTSLPTGVHAKRVERKIRHWKDKIRSCNFRLMFAVPQTLIPHLGIAAMIWCNMDPTDANVNMAPPLFLMRRGEPIDAKQLCVASFGEVVLAHEDNGVLHNSTEKSRRTECIYLFPNNAKGSHRLLILDSIEGRKSYINRVVRKSDVMPFTSLSIVARINNQAVKEINMKEFLSSNAEENSELRELTGYREDLKIDTEIDLLRRDSRTTSIVKKSDDIVAFIKEVLPEVSSQFDTNEMSENLSFLMTLENESRFWCSTESNTEELGYSFLVKKEVSYSTALKVFDESQTKDCMQKELEGLVQKWHPILSSSLSKTERKSVLPGKGLVRKKNKMGEEILKGRFVGGGHRQDITEYDIYREVSSPTAGLSSFFAVAANAAAKKLKVATFDVKQAYTKAPMPKGQRIIRVRLG